MQLMSKTRVGEFEMNAPAGKKAGPPPAVKKLLEMFGSGKEEDKLAVRAADQEGMPVCHVPVQLTTAV